MPIGAIAFISIGFFVALIITVIVLFTKKCSEPMKKKPDNATNKSDETLSGGKVQELQPQIQQMINQINTYQRKFREGKVDLNEEKLQDD